MFNRQDKPKANWTHVQDITTGEQKRSFYLSDGGAVKITRHTDKGEQQVCILPAATLEDLQAVAPAFAEVFQAFQSISEDIAKNKETKKAEARLERQKQQEMAKALLAVQVQREKLQRLGLKPEQIEAMLKVG